MSKSPPHLATLSDNEQKSQNASHYQVNNLQDKDKLFQIKRHSYLSQGHVLKPQKANYFKQNEMKISDHIGQGSKNKDNSNLIMSG